MTVTYKCFSFQCFELRLHCFFFLWRHSGYERFVDFLLCQYKIGHAWWTHSLILYSISRLVH